MIRASLANLRSISLFSALNICFDDGRREDWAGMKWQIYVKEKPFRKYLGSHLGRLSGESQSVNITDVSLMESNVQCIGSCWDFRRGIGLKLRFPFQMRRLTFFPKPGSCHSRQKKKNYHLLPFVVPQSGKGELCNLQIKYNLSTFAKFTSLIPLLFTPIAIV